MTGDRDPVGCFVVSLAVLWIFYCILAPGCTGPGDTTILMR